MQEKLGATKGTLHVKGTLCIGAEDILLRVLA